MLLLGCDPNGPASGDEEGGGTVGGEDAGSEGGDDAGDDAIGSGDGSGGGSLGPGQMATDTCASGIQWVGGNEGSELMRPGTDCVGCHKQAGEGPVYIVAGTVYDAVAEPDDCFGLEGATIEITDATGQVWTRTTNKAGNFFIGQQNGPIEFPFNAKISYGGKELPMVTAQSTGYCNTCHTQTGASLAVGRIYAP